MVCKLFFQLLELFIIAFLLFLINELPCYTTALFGLPWLDGGFESCLVGY